MRLHGGIGDEGLLRERHLVGDVEEQQQETDAGSLLLGDEHLVPALEDELDQPCEGLEHVVVAGLAHRRDAARRAARAQIVHEPAVGVVAAAHRDRHAHRCAGTSSRSAAMTNAFCSAVPMVIRRRPGIPSASPLRVTIPRCSNAS